MSNFGNKPASNNGTPVTEGDYAATLFSPGYVFGEPIEPIENYPGGAPLPPERSVPSDDTAWASEPAQQEPTPAAISRQLGADSKWILWPVGNSSITCALPDGDDIRSLWVPVVTTPITISLGFTISAPMYRMTTTGGELVPIPKGTKILTLSVTSASTIKPELWVYVTHDIFPPSKSFVGSTVIDQSNAYNTLILGVTGLQHYWPLDDAIGSLTAHDLAPGGTPLQVSGSAGFGGPPITSDGATCGVFPGGATDWMQANVTGAGIARTVMFWFDWAGVVAPGQNAMYCNDPTTGNPYSHSYTIDGTSNQLNLEVFTGNINLGPFPAIGTKHFIAVTQTFGGHLIVYYDGAPIYDSTTVNANGDLNFSQFIGGNGNSGVSPYKGYLAKLAYFNTILTPTQINQIYSLGAIA